MTVTRRKHQPEACLPFPLLKSMIVGLLSCLSGENEPR